MTETVQEYLTLNGMDAYLALFGANERNVSLLEGELGVKLSLRGSEIKIEGEAGNVGWARQVLEKLMELEARHTPIDRTTLRYACALVKEDGLDRLDELAAQVNAERAKYGLSSLTVSDELTRAACVRASEIVRQFSHTRPDGSSCFTVSGAAYGENIARGQSSADRVMAAWMSSEGHRANILRESYGSIGVCAQKVNGVIYWVQLFGK